MFVQQRLVYVFSLLLIAVINLCHGNIPKILCGDETITIECPGNDVVYITGAFASKYQPSRGTECTWMSHDECGYNSMREATAFAARKCSGRGECRLVWSDFLHFAQRDCGSLTVPGRQQFYLKVAYYCYIRDATVITMCLNDSNDFIAQWGYITSPFYPLPYPTGLDCTTTLHNVKAGQKMAIRPEMVQLQADTDPCSNYIQFGGEKMCSHVELSGQTYQIQPDSARKVQLRFHSQAKAPRFTTQRGFIVTFNGLVDAHCRHPGQLDNGTVHSSSAVFPLNSRVVFRCNSGYRLVGLPNIECIQRNQSKPTWSGPMPFCQEVITPKLLTSKPNEDNKVDLNRGIQPEDDQRPSSSSSSSGSSGLGSDAFPLNQPKGDDEQPAAVLYFTNEVIIIASLCCVLLVVIIALITAMVTRACNKSDRTVSPSPSEAKWNHGDGHRNDDNGEKRKSSGRGGKQNNQKHIHFGQHKRHLEPIDDATEDSDGNYESVDGSGVVQPTENQLALDEYLQSGSVRGDRSKKKSTRPSRRTPAKLSPRYAGHEPTKAISTSRRIRKALTPRSSAEKYYPDNGGADQSLCDDDQ